MLNLIRMIFVIFIFYTVIWYVRYEANPYNECKDHPDAVLTDKYFSCTFLMMDIDIEKGMLIKKSKTPWLDQYDHSHRHNENTIEEDGQSLEKGNIEDIYNEQHKQ